MDENANWHVATLCAVGVKFTGTREEAQEHLNTLCAHLQVHCEEVGIKFERRQGTVRRVVTGENNGAMDLEDMVSSESEESA